MRDAKVTTDKTALSSYTRKQAFQGDANLGWRDTA